MTLELWPAFVAASARQLAGGEPHHEQGQ